MHARTVVANDGLRHERRGFVVRVRNILYDVLHCEQFIAFVYERVETRADLALARRRHFVMMHFDGEAHGFERLAHFAAQIAERIHWRDWEIAALDAGTEPGVALFETLVGTPRRLFGFDVERRAMHAVVPAHGIEDEEFRLRSEECRIGDTR